MKITILCVGKLKERYLTDGVEEYLKRLNPFAKVEIKELAEERMPSEPSEAERQQVLERETERLLAAIPKDSYVIALDVVGKQISSPELAAKIADLGLKGTSHITFVIGGAFGYTDALRQRADFRWSFSQLTFTHQMIRMLLVEQIYRAYKIMRREKYHN
ncbi:MAG: 23S rRNA (pseudouridine(1915)-N(3))-methyltransferase RlmH [Phascolarctobacterium sp.]|nr:23S rRNA (pseudouridine(1915)-N(3))-methyltransferase RlmH [Candidatus Phascolarctobacterium equi]